MRRQPLYVQSLGATRFSSAVGSGRTRNKLWASDYGKAARLRPFPRLDA